MLKQWMGALAALAMALSGGGALAQDDAPKLRVGLTAWSDAEVITKLARRVLTERLGYEVELVYTGIGPMYQGLAADDLDLMLMGWLPATHASYWERYETKVEDLGVIYGPARLGWVVPDYVPIEQVRSLEDLAKPEVREAFGGEIRGIDTGAGLMRLSEQALEDYALEDWALLASSDAGMGASVARAVRGKKWVVATSWSPHWLQAAYGLRFLDDPKRTFGGEEAVHALARLGFTDAFPRAAAFVRRFKVPVADIEAMQIERASEDVYEAKVQAYLESHAEMVEAWVEGLDSLPLVAD